MPRTAKQLQQIRPYKGQSFGTPKIIALSVWNMFRSGLPAGWGK